MPHVNFMEDQNPHESEVNSIVAKMKKELKNYLHLYLGCEILLSGKRLILDTEALNHTKFYNRYGKTILILRPLSDMTEDEETEYTSTIDKWNFGFRRNMLAGAESTKFLLSKQFDIFGLIESGLAIDATTLKQTA